MRAGAAKHDAVDRIVFVRLLQCRVEFAQQPAAERVAPLRPVQRDDGRGAFDLVLDLLEFHAGLLVPTWIKRTVCGGGKSAALATIPIEVRRSACRDRAMTLPPHAASPASSWLHDERGAPLSLRYRSRGAPDPG